MWLNWGLICLSGYKQTNKYTNRHFDEECDIHIVSKYFSTFLKIKLHREKEVLYIEEI